MTTPGRALAWVVAAGLLLAGGTALSIGVAARQQLRQSELVLLVTADGDGHLTGLPLMRGGVRPLGGLRRLRAAVSKELSYFPSARVVSAGGDIGTFDEDNDLLATSEALASIAPQGVTPGLSELEVCDELVTNPITFVSANVVHPMIDLPYLTRVFAMKPGW